MSPNASHPSTGSLLATEPAADSTLGLCGLVFHRLVELVNGVVKLGTRLCTQVFGFEFSVGQFGSRVGRLFTGQRGFVCCKDPAEELTA